MPEKDFENYCEVKFTEIDENIKKINENIDKINTVLIDISAEQVKKRKSKRNIILQVAEIIVFIVGFIVSLVLRNK